MLWNLALVILHLNFLLQGEFCTKQVVFGLHNKMELWKENTSIYLRFQELYFFQSHLPSTSWGECVLIVTCLINKVPLAVLKDKAPYELLYNKKPSFEHLRIFGCLCYMSTTNQGRDKFQERVVTLWEEGLQSHDLENS